MNSKGRSQVRCYVDYRCLSQGRESHQVRRRFKRFANGKVKLRHASDVLLAILGIFFTSATLSNSRSPLGHRTKGALVHMFLPLNRPCRAHDAARRASVALARGEKQYFACSPEKSVSWDRKPSPFAFRPVTMAACQSGPTVKAPTCAPGMPGQNPCPWAQD